MIMKKKVYNYFLLVIKCVHLHLDWFLSHQLSSMNSKPIHAYIEITQFGQWQDLLRCQGSTNIHASNPSDTNIMANVDVHKEEEICRQINKQTKM